MRKRHVFQRIALIGLLFTAVTASAQGDSTQHTNPSKRVIKLLAKISEDSSKLVKFNSMISQFERDKSNAAQQAQQSADENKTAANRLADDPQDKKLARKARSAAKDAKNNSQKARVAAGKLDDLNKDIKKLTKQLEKEHTELDKYQPAQGSAPAVSNQ